MSWSIGGQLPWVDRRRMIDGMSTSCLILASQSPRRRELLAEVGQPFVVLPSQNVEECFLCSGESPAEYVVRLAYEKAREVVQRLLHLSAAERDAILGSQANAARYLVIGCDTVAECHGEVLGKPADENQARRMLEFLSGREHRVLSGLCVWPVCPASDGKLTATFPTGTAPTSGSVADANLPQIGIDVTVLRMDNLREEQLSEYLTSGLWEGKAGAFGYQDRTGWLHVISGSESNVVGLPLELLQKFLGQFAR